MELRDKSNEPAFPVSTIDGFTQYGMSLRDWFAGQALTGLCSSFTGGRCDPEWFEQIGAKAAYRIADAMLSARHTDGEKNDESI